MLGRFSASVVYNERPGGILSFMPKGFGKSHASLKVWFWRALRFFHTRVREVRAIAKALVSTKHPFLVHIIPTRRCNLACTYCNEFDDFSPPVSLEEMKKRLDILAGMGRSEEHTSELQSHSDLVCRLLLEKKKKTGSIHNDN